MIDAQKSITYLKTYKNTLILLVIEVLDDEAGRSRKNEIQEQNGINLDQ